MDRRDVLKAGAVLSLGGSGCATMLTNPAAVRADSLGGFLSALDGARATISSTPLFDSFRDPTRPDINALVDSRAALTRKVFRSLTLAGSLSDLPHEQRRSPEVVERIRDSMGEMDDAMFGMTKLLEDLSPSDRADVGKALRDDDPNLSMRILGEVDREAASLGLSSGLRLKMRTAATQVSSRLRLSPDFAIAEYTQKFRKLELHHGARAEAERQLTAAVTSELLWASTEEGGGAATGGSTSGPSPRQCVENTECLPEEICAGYKEVREGEWSPGTCQPGKRPIKRSPVLLTVGAISLGVGAAFIFPSLGTGLGGAVFITIGALIALSGLIVLIIGLAFLAGGR